MCSPVDERKQQEMLSRIGHTQLPKWKRRWKKLWQKKRCPNCRKALSVTVWHIVQGFGLLIWYKLTGRRAIWAALRAERCAACALLIGRRFKRCRRCGCFVAAKVMVKNERCPAGKWVEEVKK